MTHRVHLADDYAAIRARRDELSSPVPPPPISPGLGWTSLSSDFTGNGYHFEAGIRCNVVGREPTGSLRVRFDATGDLVWIVPPWRVNPILELAVGDPVLLTPVPGYRLSGRYPGRVMKAADDPNYGRVYLVGWASGGYSWVLAAGLVPCPDQIPNEGCQR